MIDSHVHFWNFDPIRDNWITDDMKTIRRNFAPRDLTTADTAAQLNGCVAVQANQSERENTFLLSLAEENPIIKGIVGWVDLCSEQLEERLDYWKKFTLLKGWRHVLQAENEDFILSKKLIEGIKKLNKHGFTYDLLCYHHQLGSIIKLVDQIPEQAFVLDHCGKPNIAGGDIKSWTSQIKTLASYPNVHCKISGLLTEANWKKWTANQIHDCLDVVFEHFGVERIMYGSDWPVVNLSRPYQGWLDLIKNYLSNFDLSAQQQVFSDNAQRFYRLTAEG